MNLRQYKRLSYPAQGYIVDDSDPAFPSVAAVAIAWKGEDPCIPYSLCVLYSNGVIQCHLDLEYHKVFLTLREARSRLFALSLVPTFKGEEISESEAWRKAFDTLTVGPINPNKKPSRQRKKPRLLSKGDSSQCPRNEELRVKCSKDFEVWF